MFTKHLWEENSNQNRWRDIQQSNNAGAKKTKKRDLLDWVFKKTSKICWEAEFVAYRDPIEVALHGNQKETPYVACKIDHVLLIFLRTHSKKTQKIRKQHQMCIWSIDALPWEERAHLGMIQPTKHVDGSKTNINKLGCASSIHSLNLRFKWSTATSFLLRSILSANHSWLYGSTCLFELVMNYKS